MFLRAATIAAAAFASASLLNLDSDRTVTFVMSLWTMARTCQKGVGTKFLFASYRLHIMQSTGVWTRPRESLRPAASLRAREALNPTSQSASLLAWAAADRFSNSRPGLMSCIPFRMASSVREDIQRRSKGLVMSMYS